jgi:hypothetical protein
MVTAEVNTLNIYIGKKKISQRPSKKKSTRMPVLNFMCRKERRRGGIYEKACTGRSSSMGSGNVFCTWRMSLAGLSVWIEAVGQESKACKYVRK